MQTGTQKRKVRGVEYFVVRYVEYFSLLIGLGAILTESQMWGGELVDIQALLTSQFGPGGAVVFNLIRTLCLTVGPIAVAGKGFAQSQYYHEQMRAMRRNRTLKKQHRAEEVGRFRFLSGRSFIFALLAVGATGWAIFSTVSGYGISGDSRIVNQAVMAVFIVAFLVFFLGVNKTIPLDDDISTKVDKLWTISETMSYLQSDDPATRKRIMRVCTRLGSDSASGIYKDEQRGWLIPDTVFHRVVQEVQTVRTRTKVDKPRTTPGQSDPLTPEYNVISLDTRRTNPTIPVIHNGTE